MAFVEAIAKLTFVEFLQAAFCDGRERLGEERLAQYRASGDIRAVEFDCGRGRRETIDLVDQVSEGEGVEWS